MKAWHVISKDKRLRYGDNRIVRAGKTYKLRRGKPDLCVNGMHGSVRLLDAISYACGPIVCRVSITDDLIRGDNKIVGRNRMVLWMVDATSVLHEFACRCAEHALRLSNVTDVQCWNAIATKRRWLKGLATDSELKTAIVEARYANESHAESTVRTAARSVVASLGWTPATSACEAAHESAVWYDDKSNAEANQNRTLTAMVAALKTKK